MALRKSDIVDSEILDSIELGSDGYTVFLLTTLISTSSSTKTITINLPSDGEGLLSVAGDHPIESNDRVYLTGTTGADGYYIIDSIIDNTSFIVNENINDSTDGYVYFMHPSGASQIGFDSSVTSKITAKNLQDALASVSNNYVEISQHQTLRQLIHFIDEGPGDGFASNAYKEISPSGDPFPTSVIWYENSDKIKKIVEKNITRNANKVPTTIVWKIYESDGSTIAHQITDNISYVNNVFESSRTRTIS